MNSPRLPGRTKRAILIGEQTRAAIADCLLKRRGPVTAFQVADITGIGLTAVRKWIDTVAVCANPDTANQGAHICRTYVVRRDGSVPNGHQRRRIGTDRKVLAFLIDQYTPVTTGEIVGAVKMNADTVRASLFRVAICIGSESGSKLWIAP